MKPIDQLGMLIKKINTASRDELISYMHKWVLHRDSSKSVDEAKGCQIIIDAILKKLGD